MRKWAVAIPPRRPGLTSGGDESLGCLPSPDVLLSPLVGFADSHRISGPMTGVLNPSSKYQADVRAHRLRICRAALVELSAVAIRAVPTNSDPLGGGTVRACRSRHYALPPARAGRPKSPNSSRIIMFLCDARRRLLHTPSTRYLGLACYLGGLACLAYGPFVPVLVCPHWRACVRCRDLPGRDAGTTYQRVSRVEL
jgi:hypothetical protein